MLRKAMTIRLSALAAGLFVGGVVLLAGGPDWAVVGFGCQAALIVYMNFVTR